MVVILFVVEDVLAIDASHHHVVNAKFRFCPCLSYHTFLTHLRQNIYAGAIMTCPLLPFVSSSLLVLLPKVSTFFRLRHIVNHCLLGLLISAAKIRIIFDMHYKKCTYCYLLHFFQCNNAVAKINKLQEHSATFD